LIDLIAALFGRGANALYAFIDTINVTLGVVGHLNGDGDSFDIEHLLLSSSHALYFNSLSSDESSRRSHLVVFEHATQSEHKLRVRSSGGFVTTLPSA